MTPPVRRSPSPPISRHTPGPRFVLMLVWIPRPSATRAPGPPAHLRLIEDGCCGAGQLGLQGRRRRLLPPRRPPPDRADRLRGTLTRLSTWTRHTGGFGGAKRLLPGPTPRHRVTGVMIGYPGTDKLVIGGRASTEPTPRPRRLIPLRRQQDHTRCHRQAAHLIHNSAPRLPAPAGDFHYRAN